MGAWGLAAENGEGVHGVSRCWYRSLVVIWDTEGIAVVLEVNRLMRLVML